MVREVAIRVVRDRAMARAVAIRVVRDQPMLVHDRTMARVTAIDRGLVAIRADRGPVAIAVDRGPAIRASAWSMAPIRFAS